MTQAFFFNHLWQSTVFAGIAALVAWALRKNSARVRFGVWLAASLKFLVPFSVLAALGSVFGARLPEAAAAMPTAVAAARFEPIVIPMTVSALPSADGAPWVWVLGSVWLLGSAALAVRWWLQWRRAACIARHAAPRVVDGIRLRVTGAAVEPGVFGVFHPVLLVPQGIEERLTVEQFQAVLAHERCHVRRRDNLWAALHRAVETVFWFHPLVWWIGARMIAERERACDEAVLRAGADAQAYAGGILGVCRHYMDAPLACASGVASQSGGPLQRRVRQILDGGWGRNLSHRRRAILVGLGAVALLGPVAAGAIYGQTGPTQFAVASIRPAGPAEKMSWQVDPQRLTAESMSLRSLIVTAYGLHGYQVVTPGWMEMERFSIAGTTAAPLTEKAMTALLQSYLVQQFGLKMHREKEKKDVYLLEVAPGGVKIHAMAGSLPPNVRAGNFHITYNPDGLEMTGVASMGQMAGALNLPLEQPVVNKTGLAGVYKIDMVFATPDGKYAMGRLPHPSGLNSQPMQMTAPSIFTALTEQLGLKLEKAKAPIEMLVIDSANKMPRGN